MNKNNQDHHVTSQEQIKELGKSWPHLIDSISHDISPILNNLRATGIKLEKVFPDLLKSHQMAIDSKLDAPSIKERDLLFLKEAIPDIEQLVLKLISFFGLLHSYDEKLVENVQTFSIKTMLDSLLNKYPFKENERTLIKINCNYDFQVSCDPIFIESLFNNLLENALTAIHTAQKGSIDIWTSQDDEYNILHFKDTGLGMDDDKLNRIFKRFFKNYKDSTIPGLGFCRLALLQRDGDIICNSVNGEYTEFQIKTPKTN